MTPIMAESLVVQRRCTVQRSIPSRHDLEANRRATLSLVTTANRIIKEVSRWPSMRMMRAGTASEYERTPGLAGPRILNLSVEPDGAYRLAIRSSWKTY